MSANRSRPPALAQYRPGGRGDLSRRATPRSSDARVSVPLPTTAPLLDLIRTAMLLTVPPTGVTTTVSLRFRTLLARTLKAGILRPGVPAAVTSTVFTPAVELTVIVPVFVPSPCGT